MSPGSKSSHDVLLASETIDVDDSSHWEYGDNSHTNINSSPDELNIRSPSEEAHSSKYQFNTPRHGSIVRNNNPPIVPDGKNTEWANKKFSQGSSNHISNRNPALSGQVREEVAKIEAKGRMGDPPKIDLKLKMKHKMKYKVRPLF